MTTLVLRRAVAQLPLLAAVLAVVTIGATLLGVCALLVTTTQDRALEQGLARAAPAAVDVTAFVGGVPTGEAGSVAVATRAVAGGALAPLPTTTSARASSAMRALGPQREGDRRLAYLSGVDGLSARGRLIAGRWPVRGAAVTEAAVLEPTARVLGLAPGRTVRLGPETGIAKRGASAGVTVTVVGVFRPLPDAGWDRDPLGAAGYDASFQNPVPAVAYGPFMVDPADLLAGGSTLDRLQVTAHPDLSGPAGVEAAEASLSGANDRLTAVLGSRVGLERVASELPATLADARAQQAVTRSAVLVVVLLGTALTATVLGLAGRLVAGLRAPESELLGSLGAGRGQVIAASAVEAGGLAVVAAVLAVPLSGLAHAALTHRPAVRDAGLAASPGVTVAQVVAVVAGALLLAAVLVLRPPVPARSGVDVLLAGLAAVGWWQLAAQPATGTGPDAVRILAPVLVLVAGAALVLRLVAVPLALAERLARRSRSLVLPLAAFEAARRPRVVAASLLLTLAAAAGTFGLAFGATWERSQQDQADVRVGTDLALTLVAPAVAGQGASVVAATGGVVSPVTDRTAVVGEVVGGAVPRLIAVDTTRAGALLRGRLPAGSHWDRVGAALAPAAAVTGIAVPAGDPALTLTGTLAPGTRVTPRLVLQDRAGVRTPCAAGTVPLDGRPHRLRLCEALGPGLRLVAVDLRVEQEPGATQLSGAGRLSVALSVPGAAGADPWAATSVGIDSGQLTTPSAAVSRGPAAAVVRTSATVALPGLTFEPVEVVATAFRPPGPVPVAVSGRLATTLGMSAGDPLSVTVGSTPIAMVVAEVAPAVPSVPDGPALLADVDLLSRALISTGTYEPAVDGWWVGSPTDPGAAAGLGIGQVVTRAGVAADLTDGPLRVGLPAALTVLVPAAVLLALAGTVLHVTADVDARAVARLRGLGGVPPRRARRAAGAARRSAGAAARRRRPCRRADVAGDRSSPGPVRDRCGARAGGAGALALARRGRPARPAGPHLRGGDHAGGRRPGPPHRPRRPPSRAMTPGAMTAGPVSRRAGPPRVHGPSVRGRAWAGRGPLLLSALVVALAAVLAAAVPAAMRRTADEAIADAVARAGSDAGVAVDAPFEREDPSARIRQSRSAATLADSADLARFDLGPELEAALGRPVLSVTSTLLQIAASPPGRAFRLAYVAGGTGAKVTWTAGTAPGPSVPAARADDQVPADAGPWPVRIGLSEVDAAALGLGVGDRVPLRDSHGQTLDVRVSGLFRALDPGDPAWRTAPLLRPGPGGSVTAGLLSADSLPDGRLALAPEDVNPTVTFTLRPDRVRWRDSGTVAAAVVALKASSGADGPDLRWTSRLDTVLTGARDRVTAAGAQAAVLLVGLVTTSALVLLLAADLLVRRRAAVLAGARGRGASLPGIGAELAVESLALAVVAGALGLGVARLLVAGPSWRWALPVAIVAALAGPVLGVRSAATALSARAVPANRGARRSARRTRQLRRIALEVAVVLAAAGAFTALRQRGVAPDGGVLPALAPTLGAITGGLLLLRLLPPAAALALRLSARSRRGLPLLGAARAAATAGRPLPCLVLVASTALFTYAVALSGTERSGPAPPSAPLADGLRDLATVSAVVLLAFAVLGVVLGAAASAPDRGQTLARLRTLGLRPRETRQVAVGELLPPVLAGAVGGAAVGVALAYASVGLLDLRLLTGGRTDPALVLPPLTLVPVALLAAVVASFVGMESAGRRRERLGLVLRAGTE